MEERLILESIERYIRGEMLPEERKFFDELRKSNPGIDQMVVEHTVFLNLMEKYGDRKNIKSTLQHVHNELFESGQIKQTQGNPGCSSLAEIPKSGCSGRFYCRCYCPHDQQPYFILTHREHPSTGCEDLQPDISILAKGQKQINERLKNTPTHKSSGGGGFQIRWYGFHDRSKGIYRHQCPCDWQINRFYCSE